jgi:hypothetical protein
MKKMLSALLFASLFIVGSSAYAKHSSSSSDDCSCGDDFSCESSSSSHERFEGGTFVGTQDGVLFQYILEPDRTAYWNVANNPEVGTWEIKKDHVLLTTIGSRGNFADAADSKTDDATLIRYTRTTQKIKIKNEHTLEVKHIVQLAFNANQDPLKDQGILFFNLKPRLQLKRVKVNLSDLRVK